MLAFLWKKVWKNKWMMVSLLLGNILLMGIASGIPMYAQATLQRMLNLQFRQYQDDNGVYPGRINIQIPITNENGPTAAQQYETGRAAVLDQLPRSFGVPSLSSKSTISLASIGILPQTPMGDDSSPMIVRLSGMTDFAQHVTIAQGRMFDPTPRADGVIEVVVSQSTYDQLNLFLNTIYVYQSRKDGVPPLEFVITGVISNDVGDDIYWTPTRDSFGSTLANYTLFMDFGEAKSLFLDNFSANFPISAVYTVILDASKLSVRDTATYLDITAALHTIYDIGKYNPNVSESLTDILSTYQAQSRQLNLSLWVLQAPVFIMIIFFIFMVTKQILSLDRNDISVLKSRGASRSKIVLIYFLQGVMVCVVGYIAGLGLGWLICRIIGASDGFLNLVSRAGLPISLNPEAFLYMGAAVLVSMATMILPVLGYAKVGIVDLKRELNTRKKSIWQTLFLDVLALIASVYGLYTFNTRKDIVMLTGAALHSVDPLMFLTSSLFVIGLGLFCLRIFPRAVSLIFRLFRRFISTPMYASLLRVTRTIGEEQFIMIFLMFTLATGIFNAKIARTINQNTEDQINYTIGADVAFQQQWANNSAYNPFTGTNTPPTMYYEPDFDRFTRLPGVVSAAKVLVAQPTFTDSGGQKLSNVTLMGIKSDDFGRTVWFRDGLLPAHINNYLNVLALDPRGVLLSSNLKQSYKIGDHIQYSVNYAVGQKSASGVVDGFVDYWPGYSRFTPSANGGGDTENYLIVSNLSYLQSQWGVMPYQVWLKTDTASDNFVVDYANQNNILFTSYNDAKGQIVDSRNAPLLQGMNGALTVAFIISLIVCAVGFLIYWILSIRGRVLQFGVFRAMGLSMRAVIRILVNEQVLISGVAIVLGAGIGILASQLFVPIIQISYSASQQSLPLVIITEASDYIRLLVFVGVMIVICLGILTYIASKIKIAAALKLGED